MELFIELLELVLSATFWGMLTGSTLFLFVEMIDLITKKIKLSKSKSKLEDLQKKLEDLAGLKQILSPNKAQTSFVSGKYIPIFVQP